MHSYISGGKTIEVVQYQPARAGKFPALLIVHGSSGPMSSFIGGYAQRLADFGYVLFFVHYFDRTDTSYAGSQAIETHFPAWIETLTEAIDYAVEHPKVDAERIGFLGFSLGGFLSLSLASQEPRIRAVVSIVGGIPEYFAERARRMPPVLVLHGEADTKVPVKEAYRVEQLLKKLNTPYEIKIYPGQGHFFQGGAQIDALTRAFGFLQKNLHGKSSWNVLAPLLTQLLKVATS